MNVRHLFMILHSYTRIKPRFSHILVSHNIKMLTMIMFYIFKFAKQIYLMYYMDVRQFGLDQLTENVI